jgi:hypothetical protein
LTPAAPWFSAAQGWFTSTGKPLADQNPVDPQSCKSGSCVRNNPLKGIDPPRSGDVSAGVRAAVRRLERRLLDAAPQQPVQPAWQKEGELVVLEAHGAISETKHLVL